MRLLLIAEAAPVDPAAAEVVDAAADVPVAVLLVPPQAASVKVRAAASAAAPERANVFMVGVLLDTMRQMETHLLMRHYDGFLKKGRLKGRF